MRHADLRLSLLAAALVGCATTPGPGDTGYAYNVGGSYVGRLFVGGSPFDATLQLRTLVGGRVAGGFRVTSPVELDGPVRGSVVDDLLRITITYAGPDGCDGRIEGILTVEPGGDVVEGPVTVTDCRSRDAGTMSFRLRQRRDGTHGGESAP